MAINKHMNMRLGFHPFNNPLPPNLMRCQGEFERDRETAREIIRNAKDPEVMRLLYLRKVKNMPWSEAYRGLCSVRSEIDVWLAVSRYLRENYQNWTVYSDCL